MGKTREKNWVGGGGEEKKKERKKENKKGEVMKLGRACMYVYDVM